LNKILLVSFLVIILFTGSTLPVISAQNQQLPEWVRNIFIWYGQEQISEDELLNAIEWLIEAKIIQVETTSIFKDEGDFYADYVAPKNTKYKQMESIIKEEKFVEGLAWALNQGLKLPWDIKITHMECGTANAFYLPKNHEVIMCYELLEYFEEFWQKHGASDYDVKNGTAESYFFILFHELGHALIHAYDLPTTGKEENAVDQFSALLLLAFDEKAGGLSLNYISALFFVTGTEQIKLQNLAFWDEHNLDLQRFYDIFCLKYGKEVVNKEKYANKGLLSKDRAERCPNEYEKYSNNWDALLLPYYKQSSFLTD